MDLQPVDFTTGLGPLPDPLKAAQDERATQLGLQQATLGNQILTQQLQAKQAAMQRQQSFGTDFTSYLTHPTTTGLVSLFGKYPEFHDQIKEAHATLDEDQQQVNTTQLGSVAALAAKGDYQGASKILQRRIDADRAAGHDTSDDQEILDHLNDSDPAKQKGALALTTIALAGAVGPEKAAAFLKANGLSSEPYTLSQGQTRYGADNQPVASVAPKPDYLIIPEGGKAVPVGPGGPQTAGTIQGNPSAPAPGAPAPAGAHRVHGYTPRQSNGGDNPDNVVDNKIAALSKAVGVDPDAPMTPQQFQTFVQALPVTEGSGNNNPGGIKDGAFARRQPGYAGAVGQYAKFATPQAGSQAMASLLQNNYYAKGQTSIRDIIEGRPVGGTVRGTASAPAVAANPQSQPGDPAGTIYGNPKPGYHLLSPEQAQTQGLDTSKRWQVGPDGQTTAIGDASVAAPGDPSKTGPDYLATVPAGMASQIKALAEGRLPLPSSFALGKPYWQRLLQATAQYDPSFDAATAKARQEAVKQFTGNGKAAQLVGSVNRVANHLQTLYDASEKLVGPNMLGIGPLASATAYAGQRFQPGTLKAYNTALPLVAGELEKIARGNSGTLHGVEQIMANLSPNESLQTRRQAIKTAIDLIHGAIEPLQNQYNSAFTGSSARPSIPWVTPRSQSIYDRLSGEDFSLGSQDSTAHEASSGPPSGGKLIGKTQDGRPVYLLPNGRKVAPR